MFENKKIQNSVVTVGLLLSVFLLAKTIAEVKGWAYIGKDVAAQSAITVSGKGEKVVKPDIASFSFSVTEESMAIAEAQNKAADTIDGILSFLKKNGIDEKDIKTTSYNIYPRYEYGGVSGYSSPRGKRTLAAYAVSQSIEVKVRKLEDAGKLIGSLGELGATDLSGLTFSVDKEDEIRKEARQLAIVDAAANANELAKDLGVTLVRVLNYSENGSYPPVYYGKAMSPMGMGGAESASPSVPSGENKITSQVSITYEIR